MSNFVKDTLRRYKELAHACAATDYGDRLSVKKHNSAAMEMRSISQQINSFGTDGVNEFGALLADNQSKVSLWAAHDILEMRDAPQHLIQRAITVIEGYANGDDADALGERMWLRQWHEQHKQGNS